MLEEFYRELAKCKHLFNWKLSQREGRKEIEGTRPNDPYLIRGFYCPLTAVSAEGKNFFYNMVESEKVMRAADGNPLCDRAVRRRLLEILELPLDE